MKQNQNVRLLLVIICGVTIVNNLVLVPLLSDYRNFVDSFKNFFGFYVIQSLDQGKDVIPSLVQMLVHLVMVAGLAIGLTGMRSSTGQQSMQYGLEQWGVATPPPQPPTVQSPPPPPPPPPAF